jgi:hypothetical protein
METSPEAFHRVGDKEKREVSSGDTWILSVDGDYSGVGKAI